jgi:imidazolonepropionase-like amidohydrolase
VGCEAVSHKQKLVGAMSRAGVTMLAGTDALNPYCFPGFALHDELALLVDAGVSTLGALQAATRNAALFMDASDKYGSVSAGEIADLVLLHADPVKDIHNTARVSRVFLAGKHFDRAALDRMLREAESVAKAMASK